MSPMPITARLLCVAALTAFAVGPAHAAEDYDSCGNTITALPVVIGTAGTWCLTSDLVATAGDYMKIQITANNVTLDCNNFRIDGSQARSSRGILASQVNNLTIRNCRIDGFDIGIEASGEGMLIEDNRFGDMAALAINVHSTGGGTLRRNTIIDVDTGMVVSGSLDVMDNIIEAVTYGIHNTGALSQGVISGNHILMKFGDGILIYPGSSWLVAANEISRGGPGEAVAPSTDGIRCGTSPRTAVRDNLVNNFEEAIPGTCVKIGNTIQ